MKRHFFLIPIHSASCVNRTLLSKLCRSDKSGYKRLHERSPKLQERQAVEGWTTEATFPSSQKLLSKYERCTCDETNASRASLLLEFEEHNAIVENKIVVFSCSKL